MCGYWWNLIWKFFKGASLEWLNVYHIKKLYMSDAYI